MGIVSPTLILNCILVPGPTPMTSPHCLTESGSLASGKSFPEGCPAQHSSRLLKCQTAGHRLKATHRWVLFGSQHINSQLLKI